MSEPKTPNLGLNTIDRSSPSTTYFDLDKYLDQNWEKIDDFAEQMGDKAEKTATKVRDIQERLDVEKRRTVTLEPGLQIIHAERASTFKFEGMKGRTLVNLLGRDGGFESMSSWFTTAGVASELDLSQKTQGNQSIKISLKEGSTGGSLYKLLGQTLSTSKNYIAIADLKRGTSTSVSLTLWNGTSNVSGTVVTTDQFSSAVLLIPAASIGGTTNNLQISIVGSVAGQFGHVDAVRLYEVTPEELNALSSLSAEKIASKYPYVDSVQSVLNPYVIRYGQNLLPPFYEWKETAIAGPNIIEAPYRLKMTKAAGTTGFSNFTCTVNVSPSTDYTFSITVDVSNFGGNGIAGAYWNGWYYDEADKAITSFNTPPYAKANGTFTLGNSFKTPANAKSVRIVVGFDNDTTGTAIFKNATLNLGTSAMTFKPREDSLLALQTELHAHPDTGANPDIIFERDGQYFKLSKWKKIILDGTRVWKIGEAGGAAGLKQVKSPGIAVGASSGSGIATKFNGKLLPQGSTGNTPDTNAVTASWDVYISIPNTDSGWGNSYTPTEDEIKAYFMGWRMRNWNDLLPYSGTGEKAWATVASGGAALWTATLPTTQAADWTAYQLLYQLATPIIEPITSQGQLTFNQGRNQVELGTGIVLHEVAPTPARDSYGRWNIGNKYAGPGAKDFKNKSKLVLNVYKDGKLDPMWFKFSAAQELILGVSYDPSADYSVTYLMSDQYPASDITGTYAENEKALLRDTVQALQENTARISVLESKKAEKDEPTWITPTLLNGISFNDNNTHRGGYYKNSLNVVQMSLAVIGPNNNGIPQNATICILPIGYRPAKNIFLTGTTTNALGLNAQPVTIVINKSGEVALIASVTSPTQISVTVSGCFLAEQ